jgi:hypothetical protein
LDWRGAARAIWGAVRARPLLLAAYVAAAVALAVPLFAARWLPFQDWPQHLALASVIRHGRDPAWGFDRYFVVQWLELSSYWMQYATLAALSLLVPLEVAARLQLAVVFAATLLAAASLCRAYDRSPWIGLLVAPTLYNTNLHYGFISFCMGVPLWLWALAATERLLAAPSRRRAVGAGALYVATFFTHHQIFVLLVATVGVLVLCHSAPKDWRERAWRLLPLAVVVGVLFLPWLVSTLVLPPPADEAVRASGVDQSYGRLGALGLTYRDFKEVVLHFFRTVLSTVKDMKDRVVFVSWALLATAAVVLRRTEAEVHGWRAALHAFRLEALLGVTVAAFLYMPSSMKGLFYISPRFLPLALLLWALLPRFRSERAAAAFGLGAVALTVWLASIMQAEYRRFDREVGNLDAALAALPMGSATLVLEYGRGSDVAQLEPFLHVGAYAMVRRGGIVSNTFAKTAGVPVRYLSPEATPVYKTNSNPLDARNVAFFDHVLVFRGPGKKKGGKRVEIPRTLTEARRSFTTLYEDDRWIVLAYPPRGTLAPAATAGETAPAAVTPAPEPGESDAAPTAAP